MGCRHYFVVDRLEDLVDEGGSRSSWRAHEHESFRLVLQQNVAIQIVWSQCQPRLTLNALIVNTQRSPRSIVICIFFQIEVRAVTKETCLRRVLRANNGSPRSTVICIFFLNWVLAFTRETWMRRSLWANNGSPPFYRDLHLLHERNVFRFPENGALFLSKQRVSPFYHDLDLGFVGNFLLVEQLLLLVVEQLLNSLFQSCFKEICGGSRGDMYTFSYMTSPVSAFDRVW